MIGTIIGIIVGLVSIVLAAIFECRRRKYPKWMSFYVLDAVRLTSPIVDELKNVTLVYDDKPITKTVSYLKTLFANSGTEDIDLQLQQRGDILSIKLPNECRWLTVELKEKSKGLEISLEIDENNPSILYITGGVFRKDEMFSFDAFIEGELTKEDVEEKKINISHRFHNTENVKVEKMYDIEKKGEKRFIFPIIYSFVMSIVLLFSLYIISSNTPAKFVERDPQIDPIILYSAYVGNMDSLVVVRDNEIAFPWNRNQLSLHEFNDTYKISTLLSREQKSVHIMMVIVLVFFVIMLVFWIILIWKYRPRRKIVKRYLELISTDIHLING